MHVLRWLLPAAALFLLPGAAALGVHVKVDAPLPGAPLEVDLDESGARVAGPVAVAVDAEDGIAVDARLGTAPDAEARSTGTDPAAVASWEAVATATAAGAVATGLLWKAGAWRVLCGMALALYSRIAPSETLRHPRRAHMMTLIRETPGIALNDIHDRVGLGWGTTVYHLDRLERAGLVVSERVGNARRFFVPGLTAPGDREAHGVLRTSRARDLARYVAANPGATQSDLCRALDLMPSDASKHLSKLERVGLVRRVREGRFARAYPGDGLPGLLAN